MKRAFVLLFCLFSLPVNAAEPSLRSLGVHSLSVAGSAVYVPKTNKYLNEDHVRIDVFIADKAVSVKGGELGGFDLEKEYELRLREPIDEKLSPGVGETVFFLLSTDGKKFYIVEYEPSPGVRCFVSEASVSEIGGEKVVCTKKTAAATVIDPGFLKFLATGWEQLKK